MIYLGTSATVKHYILEASSDVVASAYSNAWQGVSKFPSHHGIPARS